MLNTPIMFGFSREKLVWLTALVVLLVAVALPVPNAYAATDCATVTDVTTIECDALVTIYNENNGAAWNNATNWLDDDTVCDWYGVTCLDGHISALQLQDNNLTGVISLSGIGHVLEVNLSGNAVVRQETTEYLLLGLFAVVVIMGVLTVSIFTRANGAKRGLQALGN